MNKKTIMYSGYSQVFYHDFFFIFLKRCIKFKIDFKYSKDDKDKIIWLCSQVEELDLLSMRQALKLIILDYASGGSSTATPTAMSQLQRTSL